MLRLDVGALTLYTFPLTSGFIHRREHCVLGRVCAEQVAAGAICFGVCMSLLAWVGG